MSDFSFRGLAREEKNQNRNDYNFINRENSANFYYPYSHGEQLIDGQVYYLKRKKPPTPYALFIKDRIPQMKRENPRGDVGKFFIELGREWHFMSNERKCEYYMLYNNEVKKFELLKKLIPIGINPMLRTIPRNEFNEVTKRPKNSESMFSYYMDGENEYETLEGNERENNIFESEKEQYYEENLIREDYENQYKSEQNNNQSIDDIELHSKSANDDKEIMCKFDTNISNYLEKQYYSD